MRPEKHFGENFPLLFPRSYFSTGRTIFSILHSARSRRVLFFQYISCKSDERLLSFVLYAFDLCSLLLARNGRLCAIKKISHPKGRIFVFLEALFFWVARSRCKTISCKSNVTPPFQRRRSATVKRKWTNYPSFVHERTHKSTTRISKRWATLWFWCALAAAALLCFCAPVVCDNQMHGVHIVELMRAKKEWVNAIGHKWPALLLLSKHTNAERVFAETTLGRCLCASVI